MIETLRRRRRRVLSPDQCSQRPTLWQRAHDLELADGGAVSPWANGQGSAGGQFAEATLRPTFRVGQANTWPAVEFDGADDRLSASSAPNILLSEVATPTAFEAFALFLADAINTTSATATANDAVILATDDTWGLFLNGTGPVAQPFVNDGSGKVLGLAIALGAWTLVRWRLEGGQLIGSAGDGPESSAACGAIAAMTGALRLGRNAASAFLDGQIAEVAIWDRTLPVHERLGVREYFREKYGA